MLIFLRERTHALVGIHELDMGNLTNYEERVAIAENRLKAYLVEAEVPEEEREPTLNMYRVNKMLFHSVNVDFSFKSAGMRLDSFEMLHVPGHCAGHVVIRLHNFLFSGDNVLAGYCPPKSRAAHIFHRLGSLLGFPGVARKMGWQFDSDPRWP